MSESMPLGWVVALALVAFWAGVYTGMRGARLILSVKE